MKWKWGVCALSVLWIVCSDWSGQEEQNWCWHVLTALHSTEECSLLWSRHWAVPGCALGMAGEHTQQCWGSRLSVLSLSLCPLSCLAEYLYSKSAKPRKWDHITLSFLPGLQICIFQTATFSQRGQCSPASYCWHCCLLTKTGSTCDQQEETSFSRWVVWSSVEYWLCHH